MRGRHVRSLDSSRRIPAWRAGALAVLALLGSASLFLCGLTMVSCSGSVGEKSDKAPVGEAGPGGGQRPASSAAEPAVVFLPLKYYAGDEVEALVPLGDFPDAPSKSFELKPGAGLPNSNSFADPVIRSVSIQRSSTGWEAEIFFVPWSPGPGILPSIGARGIVVPSVSYNVASSLAPDDRDVAPPRPQREPPGTALYLYGFAILVLVIALLGMGAALYLVPAARAILARRRRALAYRRLRRSLAFLSRGLESAVPELFYAALARELRLYLAERIESRIPNLSSKELAALSENIFPAQGIRESAAALVAETERGRYAGELAAGPQAAAILRTSVDRAIALGAATEEAIDARL